MQVQSTYIRELYAITEAVKKWRQYLVGRKFRVFTDHHSLKHLLTQTIQTPAQHKWVSKLLGYDFEVHYKPGKENHVADALSRMNQDVLLAITGPTAQWLDQVRDYYASSTRGQAFLSRLRDNPTSLPSHTIQDGLVYLNGKLVIPPITALKNSLLHEFHASTLGGHSGVNATERRIAATFSWPSLKQEVTKFVHECEVCQTTKPNNHRPYGLLQPLPIPSHSWEDLTMYFITHLPSSNGKTTIWVIVDRLTKFAHFISLPKSFTAATLATVFLRDIYRLHGLPNTIISDRDPLFLSHFWKELFKQLGTKLLHSSSYHPQTDGQTEVVNRCLEAFLRAYVYKATLPLSC